MFYMLRVVGSRLTVVLYRLREMFSELIVVSSRLTAVFPRLRVVVAGLRIVFLVSDWWLLAQSDVFWAQRYIF